MSGTTAPLFISRRTSRDHTAYAERVARAVRPGGHVIIGTFALDGPERCSGLPIVRHDAMSLGQMLGPSFELIESRQHIETKVEQKPPRRYISASGNWKCSLSDREDATMKIDIVDEIRFHQQGGPRAQDRRSGSVGPGQGAPARPAQAAFFSREAAPAHAALLPAGLRLLRRRVQQGVAEPLRLLDGAQQGHLRQPPHRPAGRARGTGHRRAAGPPDGARALRRVLRGVYPPAQRAARRKERRSCRGAGPSTPNSPGTASG